MIFCSNVFFEKKNIFFRNFTNWYFFLFILLRILCWFRICHFSQVYFNIIGDIDHESLAKIPKMQFLGKDYYILKYKFLKKFIFAQIFRFPLFRFRVLGTNLKWIFKNTFIAQYDFLKFLLLVLKNFFDKDPLYS